MTTPEPDLVVSSEEYLYFIERASPEAGYLAWLDCGEASLPDDPALWFRQHAGVELSPGPAFGPGNSWYARLNFATTTALLDSILDRMSGSLNSRA